MRTLHQSARRFEPSRSPSVGRTKIFELSWSKPTLIWLCAACVPGLMLGLVAYYSAVGPLETRLMKREAHGLARDVDAAIRVRTAAIQIAANSLEIDSLEAGGKLDRLLSALRQAFPDFLSMEILNRHGEVLAIVGELPLAATRGVIGKSKAAKAGSMAYAQRDLFLDSPKDGYFYITAKHQAADDSEWFSRTRFTRDSLERAIHALGSDRVVSIIPFSSHVPASGANRWSWWTRKDTIRAPLETAGWMVTLEKQSQGTISSYLPTIVGGLLVFLVALAYVLRSVFRSRAGSDTEAVALDGSPHLAGESSNEPTATPLESQEGGVGEPAEEQECSESTQKDEMQETDCWDLQEVLDPADSVEERDSELFAVGPAEPTVGPIADSSRWDDIPETLDVTWVEPMQDEPIDAEPVHAEEYEASQALPAAEPYASVDSLPEYLEVTWEESLLEASKHEEPEKEETEPPQLSMA